MKTQSSALVENRRDCQNQQKLVRSSRFRYYHSTLNSNEDCSRSGADALSGASSVIWQHQKKAKRGAVAGEQGKLVTSGQADHLIEAFIDCRQALLGYVLNILNSSKDAEDIVQETYIRLMQREHEEKVLFPKAYIFRTARNLSLDHLRRKKRSDTALSSLKSSMNYETEASSPEDLILAEEQLRLWRNAILNLPKKCRRVYTLRKMYGLSHRQIAEHLGISVRTVENHIASATKQCREYLNEHLKTTDMPCASEMASRSRNDKD